MLELRPRKKTISEVFSGDYDFVIHPDDLPSIIKTILGICTKHESHLEVITKSKNKRIFKIIKNGHSITVELWINVELAGTARLVKALQISGRAICEAVQKQGAEHGNVIKAALYITHISYKKKSLLEGLQVERIQFFTDSLYSLSQRESLTSSVDSLKEVYAALLRNDNVDLARANSIALRVLADFGLNSRMRLFSRFQQKRFSQSKIMKRIVPVIGPDGSGKTYICEHLEREDPTNRMHFPYKKFFRNLGYEFLIKSLRKLFSIKDKNKIDEKISGYLILKATIFMFFWAVKLKIEKRILFVDRYGWDYLLKGIRCDDSPPSRIMMSPAFLRLIPRPNRIIIMYGRATTVFSRKREVSEQELNFIYNTYLIFVASGHARRALFCSTELGYDSVAKDVKDFLKNT